MAESRGPFIELSSPMPGIAALMDFKPETGAKLGSFVHQILRGPSSLTPGEREVIAGYVSTLNNTSFCSQVHSAAARHLLGVDAPALGEVIDSIDGIPVSDKMRTLLRIAGKVQRSGLDVEQSDVDAARDAGASDEDIHDAVLVASAFCFFNRYVDGLRAPTPVGAEIYDAIGAMLAAQGYSAE